MNISVQAANLSDCRIESNRNFFCPNWNALLGDDVNKQKINKTISIRLSPSGERNYDVARNSATEIRENIALIGPTVVDPGGVQGVQTPALLFSQ